MDQLKELLNMNIFLQEATREDLKIIRDFMKKVESRLFHATTEEDELKEFIKDNKVFFIVLDNNKVGIVAYRLKENFNYLSELIVAPQYQKKGIASLVIKKVLEKINDKPVELFTHPENTPAIITYLKAGFVIKSWKENCYGDGEARILMVKD